MTKWMRLSSVNSNVIVFFNRSRYFRELFLYSTMESLLIWSHEMSDLVFTMIEGSRVTLPFLFASCVVGALAEGQRLM
jgi:hypothetical protein